MPGKKCKSVEVILCDDRIIDISIELLSLSLGVCESAWRRRRRHCNATQYGGIVKYVCVKVNDFQKAQQEAF